MYEYIKGSVAQIHPSYLVLENNGIGYHILMANPFRLTNEESQEVTVYLYQNITQDDMQLFGFRSYNEKLLFLNLISVSGIGPKSALAILANEDHAGLIRAIENEDVKFLQKFPGVGKKTASQIVLDLKGKLADLSPEIFTDDENSAIVANSSSNPVLEEAMEALKALGYTQREVKKVKKELSDKDLQKTDAYIREGLQILLHT